MLKEADMKNNFVIVVAMQRAVRGTYVLTLYPVMSVIAFPSVFHNLDYLCVPTVGCVVLRSYIPNCKNI